MPAPQPIEVPTFTYGTYRSMDGTEVQFTDALMRDLERNTNAMIAAKVLTPPVGYDTIKDDGTYAHRGTEAHAHVTGVRYRNGVLSLSLTQPSETFVKDVREGRRLRYSGEFNPKFTYTAPDGKVVEVGPTVVGLAALGRMRPALKNPVIVPLSDLNFGEGVSAAEAIFAREELRTHRFVAQTLADGKYAFSEIEVDPAKFEEQEQGMTEAEKAEMQTMMRAAVDAAVTPLKTELTSLKTENDALKGDVKRFSETTKRDGDTRAFCESLTSDRKAAGNALPKLFMDAGAAILNDNAFSEAQREQVKKLMTLAPGARLDTKTDDKHDTEDDAKEEPKALAAVKPRWFAEVDRHEADLAAGMQAFCETFPDRIKGIEKNEQAIHERFRQHVRDRDLGPRADA